MMLVGDAVIEDDIARTAFCCDLEACKGSCCCLEGGRGAPLEDDEVLEIEKAYPAVRGFLSSLSLQVIARTSLVEGSAGDHVTPCVSSRECVYVYFQDGIAKCSFERAYELGTIDWRKPLSCHLFPIRIRGYDREHLLYERIEECEAGRRRGERQQVKLHEFLKDPLIRKYGESWYREFSSQCDDMTLC